MGFNDRIRSDAVIVIVVLSVLTMTFLNVAEMIGYGLLEPLF